MSWMEKIVGTKLPEGLANNTIALTDGQGESVVFELLDLIRYDGREYLVLIPEMEVDDSGEVVILRVENADGDGETYSSETDGEILFRVYERFRALQVARFGERYCFSAPYNAALRGSKPLSDCFGGARSVEDFAEYDEVFDHTLITLFNGDGHGTHFEYLDLVEYKRRDYVVLLPAEDDEDDGEVVILRVTGESGEEFYAPLRDEEELFAVYERFKERFKDVFHFT